MKGEGENQSERDRKKRGTDRKRDKQAARKQRGAEEKEGK